MVEFKEEKTKDGCKVIECVPSSWITYDHKLGSCVVQYMAPPYSTEDYKLIQDLIKSRAQPPEGWPRFSVNLKGNANSYKEGMIKLNILQVQPYTTDSESRGIEKAQKAVENLKSRADVKKMLSKENNESSSELSYTDTSSSDEEWKRQTKDKKKFVIEDSDETPTLTKPKHNINMKQKTLKKAVTQKKSKCQTVFKKPAKQYKNIIDEPYMSSVKSNMPNTSFTSSLRKSNKTTVENSSTIETIQEQASEDINILPDELNVEFSEMSTDTTLLKKTLTFLYVAMKKLTIEINLMKNDTQALRNSIERLMLVKNNQISTPAFVEKYNFVKIQCTEEFKTFDSELQTNDEFAKDFKDVLEQLIGSNMKQSIIAIMKKFLHRDFAMKCTAIKLSNNKFVLKNTYFYNSLFDIICRYHKNPDGGIITEKMFYQSLSSCLTNAKDWDGYRKLRQPAATQDKT